MAEQSTIPERPLRVLLSYKEPSAQTNPYIVQLHDALASTSGLARRSFSWKTALIGRYDVFHAHWPEALLEQRGWVSTWGRRVLYALILAKLWLLRIPVVRTVHNIELPSGIGRIERWLLTRTDSLTRMRILLNEFTPVPPAAMTKLIVHGHYRDWFDRFQRDEPVPGRYVFFGRVRRYKNVDGLIRAFRAIPLEDRSLHVAGNPSSRELAESLRTAAAGDSRINLALQFIEDPELVREVTQSELVVLPYPEMHNSGSVLAALSLDRPVLVPDNAFNRALSEEVGEGWVLRFSGRLDAADLEKALEAAAALEGSPDLSLRDWDAAGRQHFEAYAAAVTQRRGGRRE